MSYEAFGEPDSDIMTALLMDSPLANGLTPSIITSGCYKLVANW